jgi:hypothetical protein
MAPRAEGVAFTDEEETQPRLCFARRLHPEQETKILDTESGLGGDTVVAITRGPRARVKKARITKNTIRPELDTAGTDAAEGDA